MLCADEAIPVLGKVTLCKGEVFILLSFVYLFAGVPTAGFKLTEFSVSLQLL